MFHKLSFLLICIVLLGIASGVLAHGSIVRTNPTDGAQLDSAPAMVQVWFDQPVQPDTGTLTVINGKGERVDQDNTRHDPTDSALIEVDLNSDLPVGTYIVSAAAVVVSDGHTATGSYVFWVGERETTAVRENPKPAYSVFFFFIGLMLAAGGAGYYFLYLRPGLEVLRPDHPVSEYPLE